MRSKKALLNTAIGMGYEVVAIVCGLILPRLILSHYGSAYNGISSSISQFLSVIELMSAGIGGVTRALLYKPLADNNTEQVSSIVKTTERYMRKITCAFVGMLLVLACVYPIWVKDEFSWFFAFSLILIQSFSTVAQYFFCITYQMVLHADQRRYVIFSVQIITTTINTLLSIFLITNGCTIHVVRLASAIVFAAHPLVINIYVRKKYNINSKAPRDNSLLKQRWDAFGHQVAFFVHNNTDLMVLTIFSNLFEVSVYTVYNYALRSIRAIIVVCVSGIEAAFGNMFAREERVAMEKNIKVYELVVFSLTSVMYAVVAVMIVPFALLYTSGVQDVDYRRPLFAMIMTLAGAFSCYRIPYKTITDAVGHFKQTRNGSFVEAGLNVVISIIGVIHFGIIGVAFGTLVATVFRSIQYAIYLSRNIIPRSMSHFVKHVIFSVGIIGIVYIISQQFITSYTEFTIISWVVTAIIVTVLAAILTIGVNLLFYRDEMRDLIKKIQIVFKRKKNG